MTEHNWVDGEAPRAVDIRESLQKQVVVITPSTARGTAWLGKHVFESNRSFLSAHDGTSWRTYGRGIVGVNHGTGTGPGIVGSVVAVNGSAVTATLYTGEWYTYHWSFNLQATAGDVFTIRLRRDGTNYSIIRDYPISTTGSNEAITGEDLIAVTSDGSYVHDMSIVLASGPGSGYIPTAGDFWITHEGQI